MKNLKNLNLLVTAAGASLLFSMVANADDTCSLSAVTDKSAADNYVNEISADLVKESESNDKTLKSLLKVMGWNPQDQLNGSYVQSENPHLDLFVSAQQRLQNAQVKSQQAQQGQQIPNQNYMINQQAYQQPPIPQQNNQYFRPLNFGVGLIERMQQRMEQFYQTLPGEMQAAIQSQQNSPGMTRNAMAFRWANSDPRFQPQLGPEGLHSAKLNFDSIKNLITLAANESLGGCHDAPLTADEARRAHLPPTEFQMEDSRLSRPVTSDFALICNDNKRVTFLIWDTAFAAPGQMSPLGTGASLTVSTVKEAENDSPLNQIESAVSTKTTMFSGQGVTFRNVSNKNNGNQISNNKIVMEKTSGESESTTDFGSGPLDSFRNRNSSQQKQKKTAQNKIFEFKGYDGSTPVQQRLYLEQTLAQNKSAAAKALSSLMQKQRGCGSNSVGQEPSNSGPSNENSRWKHKTSTTQPKELKIEISTPVEKKNASTKAL